MANHFRYFATLESAEEFAKDKQRYGYTIRIKTRRYNMFEVKYWRAYVL